MKGKSVLIPFQPEIKILKKPILLLGDILALYISLFLAILIRYGQRIDFKFQLGFNLIPFTLVFIVWLIIFYITNLYEISFTKNNVNFFSALFYTLIASSVVSLALFYFIPYFGITPKTNLLIFSAFVTAIMFVWRFYFNKLSAKSGHHNDTLIIGFNEQSKELYDFLVSNPQLGYNVLEIIDVGDQRSHENIETIVKNKKIKTLILSPSAYKVPRIIDALYRLVGFGIIFYNLSDFYEQATGRVPLGAIDQAWFLENLSEGSKRVYELSKRIFDLIFGVILGAISLPFYPFIMLAIRIDSSGPIFYRQERVGKAGKIIKLIKFRTMFNDAEKNTGPIWAAEDDNRTTRVGKIIRKTRIDELPQIINVLQGDMSFVGPRPERPEFYEKLKKEIPFYEERNLVKPGLTGWAQIKHKLDFRGGMTVKDTYEKLQHDLYYVKKRSLMLDLGVVLKTTNILLKKALG